MSVTVYVECVPTGRFSATCEQLYEKYWANSYEEILAVIVAHKAECEECERYGLYSSAEMDVDKSVNLANANAAMIFAKMGLELDFSEGGVMDPEEFLGYVLVANALDDGSGVPAARIDGGTGATVIDCGYAPGYIDQRLVQLAEVALEAHRLGRQVVWN